ncbi:membrane protein PknM or lipoprotein LppH [Mycobacteroides abscessus subsp. abscessus]|nr:membrane protein PknM or lipoprotein LppH [Mycobacteroides abscessus subsp. abscessus]
MLLPQPDGSTRREWVQLRKTNCARGSPGTTRTSHSHSM